MSRENKYEIDMCNGSIMDKLISVSYTHLSADAGVYE